MLFRLTVTLAGMLLLAVSQAADRAPASVRDLSYGEVLYHYYQDDYFSSIVHLLKARQQGTLDYHADEAELLLGGLDLSYGLRDEAGRIFATLLDAHPHADVRNRAWFHLARLSWQSGDSGSALAALQAIGDEVPASLAGEVAHLQSLVLLARGDNAATVELLGNLRADRGWSPYLDYNLGVARIRNGALADGSSTLARVGELDGYNEIRRTLRDKANLALGYSYLQHDEPDRARQYLERVRLEGPLSNRALLGTGWADIEAGAYARALVPWLELGSRNTTDPAVQEVLLAIPHAMTRMQLHGRAVAHYEQAIDSYYAEQARLDESIAAILDGKLLAALQTVSDSNDIGWLQDIETMTASPALRYQVELMARHDFQEAVKNYHDLRRLDDNLAGWAGSIGAFSDMLATRRARHAGQRPAAEAALSAATVDTLAQRRQVLAERLKGIEQRQDPMALASDDENRHWQTLQALDARLAGMPETPDINALRDKQRRLQGILYWNVNSDYRPRLWSAKQQLRELDALVDETRHAHAALAAAGEGAPVDFYGFEQRIVQHHAEIERLRARTGTLRMAQGRHIETIAVAELEQQKQRLEKYLVQARYAMAQTRDTALNSHATETLP
jgi:hypothetical protein